MSAFSKYSNYYDLLYVDKDYQQESDFLQKLIQKHHPQAKSIIEFGSGSGIHSTLLAKNFDKIYGVDMSSGMVDKAIARRDALSMQEQISYVVGDIETVELPVKTDVLLSLFHVISYQTSNEKLSNVLQNAKRHMKEGGLFIFDIWYGPAVLEQKPETRIKKGEDDKISVTRFANPVHHPNDCVVDVNYEVHIVEKESMVTEVINEKHPMRYFFMPELQYILEKEGFSLLETGEWLTGKNASNDSWGVYFVCRT